jgi:hypothetical protein
MLELDYRAWSDIDSWDRLKIIGVKGLDEVLVLVALDFNGWQE